MHLENYDTSTSYTAELLSSKRITPDEYEEVRELVLDVKGLVFKYRVGQSIGVMIPGSRDIGHDYHFRLYTLADLPDEHTEGAHRISILVKRCDYIDEYSGERYKGIASNYLCDLVQNDHLTITGPYDMPFRLPDDNSANLVMIGMGTGIAPFRAFVKHMYDELGGWSGQVRLFYGGKTGLDLYYMNEHQNDFANYYDEKTFQAFQGIGQRPHWEEDTGIHHSLVENEKDIWELLCHYNTYVYVAGLRSISLVLDNVFGKMSGSQQYWNQRKAELIAGGRWNELIY